MTGWLAEQIRRNRMTRDCWARYDEHRARVTELLVGPAVPPVPDRQLALLGVGNGNDVDLVRLAGHYSRIILLSQILESAHQAFGSDHPRLFELIRVLRQRHLEQLVGALRPGGRGVILIDFVSSATCPQLTSVNAADLSAPWLWHFPARTYAASGLQFVRSG